MLVVYYTLHCMMSDSTVQNLYLTKESDSDPKLINSSHVNIHCLKPDTPQTTYNSVEIKAEASNRMQVRTMVNQQWELKRPTDNLLVTNKNFIAYMLRVRTNCVVRVIHRQSEEKELLKGFIGDVVDLSFAHYTRDTIACFDEGAQISIWNLIIVDSDISTSMVDIPIGASPTKHKGSIDAQLILRVNRILPQNLSILKLAWCPFPQVTTPTDVSLSLITKSFSSFFCLSMNSRCEIWNLLSASRVQKEAGTHSIILEEHQNLCTSLINTHNGNILDIAFSPDEGFLATAGQDGVVKCWSIDNAQCVHKLVPHEGNEVTQIRFCDDLSHRTEEQAKNASYWEYLITLCRTRAEVKLWSCKSWNCLQTLSFISQSDISPKLHLNVDLTSRFIAIWDISNPVLYITEFSRDTGTFVNIGEYLLIQPILSLAFSNTNQTEASFDHNNEKSCSTITVHCVHSRSLQELTIFHFDPLCKDWKQDQTSNNNVSSVNDNKELANCIANLLSNSLPLKQSLDSNNNNNDSTSNKSNVILNGDSDVIGDTATKNIGDIETKNSSNSLHIDLYNTPNNTTTTTTTNDDDDDDDESNKANMYSQNEDTNSNNINALEVTTESDSHTQMNNCDANLYNITEKDSLTGSTVITSSGNSNNDINNFVTSLCNAINSTQQTPTVSSDDYQSPITATQPNAPLICNSYLSEREALGRNNVNNQNGLDTSDGNTNDNNINIQTEELLPKACTQDYSTIDISSIAVDEPINTSTSINNTQHSTKPLESYVKHDELMENITLNNVSNQEKELENQTKNENHQASPLFATSPTNNSILDINSHSLVSHSTGQKVNTEHQHSTVVEPNNNNNNNTSSDSQFHIDYPSATSTNSTPKLVGGDVDSSTSATHSLKIPTIPDSNINLSIHPQILSGHPHSPEVEHTRHSTDTSSETIKRISQELREQRQLNNVLRHEMTKLSNQVQQIIHQQHVYDNSLRQGFGQLHQMVERQLQGFNMNMLNLTQRMDLLPINLEQTEKSRQDKLVTTINSVVYQSITTYVDKLLTKEMKNCVRQSLTETMNILNTSLNASFQNIMSDHLAKLENSLKDLIARVLYHKDTMDKVGTNLSKGMLQPIADTYKQVFAENVIPAFEKSCKLLFQQMDQTIIKSSKEYANQLEQCIKAIKDRQKDHASQENDRLIQHLKTELAQFEVCVVEKSGEIKISCNQFTESLHQLPAIVSAEVQKVVQGELSCWQSLGSAHSEQIIMQSEEHTEQLKVNIKSLLSQGQTAEAFNIALSASNLEVVEFICEQVHPGDILESDPPLLNQALILSLIQQLSFDLSANLANKLRHLIDAVHAVDLQHEHSPRVIRDLKNSLDTAYNALLHTDPDNSVLSKLGWFSKRVSKMYIPSD